MYRLYHQADDCRADTLEGALYPIDSTQTSV
jgi:hypothetical protein